MQSHNHIKSGIEHLTCEVVSSVGGFFVRHSFENAAAVVVVASQYDEIDTFQHSSLEEFHFQLVVCREQPRCEGQRVCCLPLRTMPSDGGCRT
ncbi:Hypothetical protein, putative [Bodo saltans]|uniref:Uncharacterized protein n=1 Tax=Bodo saltans TaxID=75058 RepID=A0A0S4J2A6_BODSA|nr:Hypothetical protein, putative [Bodo saltans]|eukprot:CUG20137.1 Hypothetical protein, putative [Bodo saltans]